MAYLANLLLPQSSMAEIERRLSGMMEAKGYERLQSATLFPYCDDRDVRVFLLSSGSQVILVCSGHLDLARNIRDSTAPIPDCLLVWQEASYWGIEGVGRDAKSGSFDNRKAGYFRNRIEDGKLTWLAGCVSHFPHAEKWSRLRSCLQHGNTFTDRAIGEFCSRLGMPFGALTFREIEDVWDGSLEARLVGEWQIQLLAFTQKIETVKKTGNESDGLDVTVVKHPKEEVPLCRRILIFCATLLIAPLIFLLMMLAISLVLLILLFYSPLAERIRVGKSRKVRNRFLEAVLDSSANPIQLSSGIIFHTIHRCSVSVPSGIEAQSRVSRLKTDPFPWNSPVFDFKVSKLWVRGVAYRPDLEWGLPSLPKYREQARQTEFAAGSYSGTRVFYQTRTEKSVWLHYDWFIITPQAIYKFSLNGQKKAVSEDVLGKVDELVRSFELKERSCSTPPI